MRAHVPILVACALALPAAAQGFDPYDPAALVALAREAMREDELRTACVLLARAGQLAPHDARVELAWGDYAARQQGLAIPEASAAKGEEKPGPRRGDREVAPEPPAPWPAK